MISINLCSGCLKLGEITFVPRIQKGHVETDHLLVYQMSEVLAESRQAQKWDAKKEKHQVRIIASLRDKCRECSMQDLKKH